MGRHTGPDWGAGASEFISSAYAPSALEAMASIGGPHVWFPTGHVIYADGFEQSLAPWGLYIAGTGAAIIRTARKSFAGAYSLEITPSSAGGGQYGQSLSKQFPLIKKTRTAFEIMIDIEDDAVNPVALPFVRITVLEDFTAWKGSIVIDANNGKLLYESANNSLSDLVVGLNKIGANAVNPFFHVLKLEIDPNTHKYVSALFDSLLIDMSTKPLVSMAITETSRYVNDVFGLWTTDVAGQQKILFDNAIVTVDEP